MGDPKFNVDVDLKYPHVKLPNNFPYDQEGASVPSVIFKKKLKNGEFVARDWLVWSRLKAALFCLPCKLFSTLPPGQKSLLASPDGYSSDCKWRKLYQRVPEHEATSAHKTSFLQFTGEWK